MEKNKIDTKENYIYRLDIMKNYMRNETVSEEKLRLFVRVLCSMRLTEDTIHGIVAMLGDNLAAMDELVQYIKEHPTATEAEVTKAASTILGIG